MFLFLGDIGATMSLFLGASISFIKNIPNPPEIGMLTILEVLYFVLRNTRIYRSIELWRQRKFSGDKKQQERTKVEIKRR